MLFEIQRDLFLDGLSKTTPIAEKKSTLPILSHLLMDAREDRLLITATDLSVGLQVSYDCNVSDPGVITVPSKKVHEIVRELPPGPVRVELAPNGRIKLVTGGSDFELAGMDPMDYPAWASLGEVETVSIPAHRLAFIIDKAAFAASTDDSRFNLNGVLFEQYEDKTRLVATDGHRLAMVDEQTGLVVESKFLVPRRSLMDARRLLEGLKEPVSLGFEPKNLIIKGSRFTMTARLISGDYPDYRKVVPPPGEKILTVDRSKLTQSLRRVGVLTSDRNRGVNFRAWSGYIELIATHPDLGVAKDRVEVGYEGDEIEFIVNSGYLIEALSVIDTDSVTMEYQKEGGPIIIRPNPPADYFNLVMPMRKAT
jgi:DNA polymerase-3 subunit beta